MLPPIGYPSICRRFTSVFHLELHPLLDVLFLPEGIAIDLGAFERAMAEHWGDIASRSLEDVVREHYGEEGVALIRSLL